MTFYTSADAVFNLAIGYIQYINENLTINGGFKTDFCSQNGQLSGGWNENGQKPWLNDLYFDKYHLIAGPNLEVQKFVIVLGIQYTWGRQKDLYNFINLSDPVEYNAEKNLALQGERQANMSVNYNEVSVFFGVTYGFGQ